MPSDSNRAKKVANDPETVTPGSNAVVSRWGGDAAVVAEGFLAVPIIFLKYYPKLKPYGLSPTEALFILELMVFKWDERAPFPGYKTIAERMGISEIYARKLARTLESKGFMTRIARIGATNQFDLAPLFQRLAKFVKAQQPQLSE